MRHWVIVLAACGGAPSPAPVAPEEPAPKRDLAVAEPTPKQPEPPEPALDPYDSQDVWLIRGLQPQRGTRVLRRVVGPAEKLDVAASDLWSACVKDFVQRQSEDARRAWTTVFARYVPSCDADQRVMIDPPREYYGKPYVAFHGVIGGELVVEIASCTASSAERVVIAYDGKRWTAPLHDSAQRAGCIFARVPDTRTARRVLRDALDASRAVVQLDGDEVAITDDMKRDLHLVLDALSAP